MSAAFVDHTSKGDGVARHLETAYEAGVVERLDLAATPGVNYSSVGHKVHSPIDSEAKEGYWESGALFSFAPVQTI
jgi:hypothetical protein